MEIEALITTCTPEGSMVEEYVWPDYITDDAIGTVKPKFGQVFEDSASCYVYHSVLIDHYDACRKKIDELKAKLTK